VHLAHGLDSYGRLATLVDALLLGSINTDTPALQNEPSLHLGNHAQQGYQDAAGVRGRAELRHKQAEPSALQRLRVSKRR